MKKYLQIFLGASIVATTILTANAANKSEFQSGIDLGKQTIQSMGSTPSTSVGGASVLPDGQAWQDNSGQVDTLKSYYRGGKNGADSITNIGNKGTEVKNSSNNCDPTDMACKARNANTVTYDGIGSNPYDLTAEALKNGLPADPFATLGINTPSENGGSVCVETTVTTEPSVEATTCLETQFRKLNILPKIPATTAINTYTPECLAGTSLSADGSTCNQNVYSCPEGGSINGTTCTNTKPLVTTLSYTSPVCLDPSYSISGDLSTCNKTTYSCPAGSTLNGTTCTQTTSTTASVTSYTGTADCNKVSGLVPFDNNVADRTTMSYACSGGNMQITSDAYGSNGGLYRSQTATHSINDTIYSNRALSTLAPHWSGKYKQVATFVSGGCSSGTCSYTYTANYVGGNTAWASYSNCTGGSRNGRSITSYAQNTSPNTTHSISIARKIIWGERCTSDSNFNHTFPVVSPGTQIGSHTISFPDPRSPVYTYSCPAGYTKINDSLCSRTFPATATNHTATPGCLGGRVADGNNFTLKTRQCYRGSRTITCVADGNNFTLKTAETLVNGTQSGGTKTCQSTNYTCPAGVSRTAENSCSINYPATGTNVATQPGCSNGNLTRVEYAMGFYCNSEVAGTGWVARNAQPIYTTNFLSQYKKVSMQCNFEGTDINQFIGLDGNTDVQDILVDRVVITPADGSQPITFEAEDYIAGNAVPVNKISDPVASNGFAHKATSNNQVLPPGVLPARPWALHASNLGRPNFTPGAATVDIYMRTDAPATYALPTNKTITVKAAGWHDSKAAETGAYVNGVKARNPYRGWSFVAYDKNLNTSWLQGDYDLFGRGTAAVQELINGLNAVPNGSIIALYTYDEPSTNFHNHPELKDYLVNVLGANRSLLDQIGWRSSYALLVEKGGQKYGEGYQPEYGSVINITANVEASANNYSVVCATESYNCPAGQTLNGNLCEDPQAIQYEQDPKCVNLGYDPGTGDEVFYCDTGKLNECDALPANCTETDARCVYKDDVIGSPTLGECLAWDKSYDCPVPGKDVVTQNCGFDPLCFDGNCFEKPEKKCKGVFNTINKPVVKQCYETIPQTQNSCPLEVYYDIGGNLTPKVRPSAACDAYINDPTCKQVAITKDADGNYPSSVFYSCLGDPVTQCDNVTSDPTCNSPTKDCIQYEDLRGLIGVDLAPETSGRCLEYQVEYQCTETYTEPGDECTEDMARTLTAMEVSRQGSNYIDINDVRIFAGDYARCDRRSAAWAGGGFGSKSCCNISAPDPQTDHDFLKSQTGYSDVSVFQNDVKTVSNLTYDIMRGKLDTLSAIEGATAGANLYNAYTIMKTSYVVAQGLQAGLTLSEALAAANYNPWGLAISATIAVYMNYQAALACDDMDYETATSNKAKLCYPTKTECAKEQCGVFGCVCAKMRTSQCCYNSKLARIINDQGKRQLGVSRANDTCGGFTVAEVEALDWTKIDLTEFVNEMIKDAQARMPKATDIQEGIQNNKNKASGRTTQLDKPARLTVP